MTKVPLKMLSQYLYAVVFVKTQIESLERSLGVSNVIAITQQHLLEVRINQIPTETQPTDTKPVIHFPKPNSSN